MNALLESQPYRQSWPCFFFYRHGSGSLGEVKWLAWALVMGRWTQLSLWSPGRSPLSNPPLPAALFERLLFKSVSSFHRVSIRKPCVVHGHSLKHSESLLEVKSKWHILGTLSVYRKLEWISWAEITPIHWFPKPGCGQGSRHTRGRKIFSNMR